MINLSNQKTFYINMIREEKLLEDEAYKIDQSNGDISLEQLL